MKRLFCFSICFAAALLCGVSCSHGNSGNPPAGADVQEQITNGAGEPDAHFRSKEKMPENKNVFLTPAGKKNKSCDAVIADSFKKVLPRCGYAITEVKSDAGLLLRYKVSVIRRKRMTVRLHLTASAPDGKVLWEGSTRVSVPRGEAEPYLPGLVVCAVHYFGETVSFNKVSLPEVCPGLLNAVYQ